MPSQDAATETPILAQLGKIRSPLESWLLRRGMWLVLIPFGLTLLLNLYAVARFGVPAGAARFVLANLFDPVYQTFVFTLAMAAVLIYLFFQAVPRAFVRLAEQQVIDEREPGGALVFVLTYQRWIYHPFRFVTGAAFALLALFVDYTIVFGRDLARLAPGHEPASIGVYAAVVWLSNWINGLGILGVLYVGGLLIFKMLATARLIHNTPSFFRFDIQPSHPDKCGGFKAIGDLCLKMVYIVVVMGVFLGFWLFVSKHMPLSPELQAVLPPYVLDEGFRTPAKVLIVLLAAAGVAVFFWPMLATHNVMAAARDDLQKNLDAIARRIHELDRALLGDPAQMAAEDRKKLLSEIETLRMLYDHTTQAPTWPFERSVALKFASTQAIPLLSLLGLSGGPFNQLLQVVLALVGG